MAWTCKDFWNSKNNRLNCLPKRFLVSTSLRQDQLNSLWKEKVPSHSHLQKFFSSFLVALYKALQSFSSQFEDGMVKSSFETFEFRLILKRCDEQISVHISRHTAISIPSDNADISFVFNNTNDAKLAWSLHWTPLWSQTTACTRTFDPLTQETITF